MNSAVSVLDDAQPGPLRFMLVVLALALCFTSIRSNDQMPPERVELAKSLLLAPCRFRAESYLSE